jgi:hypothetical protein
MVLIPRKAHHWYIGIADSRNLNFFQLFLYQLSQPLIGEIGMRLSQKLFTLSNNVWKSIGKSFSFFLADLIDPKNI